MASCVSMALCPPVQAVHWGGGGPVFVPMFFQTWQCRVEPPKLECCRSLSNIFLAGFEGLSSWWQQGIGSGHSTWAFTVHVRHPMCVRCKE
jgi:hypothetical protein